MDLDGVTDELYGLPLESFTPTRTAREKEAKAAGDKDLAAGIRRLGKPNQVGWLANQLSRQHGDEITPLLELGAELRDASSSLTGDQLRAFTAEQHKLVHALVQQARRIAADAGKRVSEDTARGVQETLRAALADPEAGERLVAGHLTEGLQYVGFGPGGEVTGSRPASARKVAHEQPSKPAATEATDARSRRLERADRDLERAKAATDAAVEKRDGAQSELDDADSEVARLEGQVARLRAELDEAVATLSHATRGQGRARTRRDRADAAVRQAERGQQKAERARQRIVDEA